MRSNYLLFAGVLAFTSCSPSVRSTENSAAAATTQSQNGTEKRLETVSSTEAKTLLENNKEIVILDVRTPEEYSAGHLKNAVLLNKYAPDFETQLKALDPNKTYLVYCASGGRSGQTLELMKQWNFKEVYDAKGYEDLKKAGVPVEK